MRTLSKSPQLTKGAIIGFDLFNELRLATRELTGRFLELAAHGIGQRHSRLDMNIDPLAELLVLEAKDFGNGTQKPKPTFTIEHLQGVHQQIAGLAAKPLFERLGPLAEIDQRALEEVSQGSVLLKMPGEIAQLFEKIVLLAFGHRQAQDGLGVEPCYRDFPSVDFRHRRSVPSMSRVESTPRSSL